MIDSCIALGGVLYDPIFLLIENKIKKYRENESFDWKIEI